MHDNLITSYEMNFKNKTLIMRTNDEMQNKEETLIASDVLTYSFESILEYNIILDIEEWKIGNFTKENIEQLEKMRNYCWPIRYNNIQELEHFLVNNNYKYIKIVSSYGLYGWILAKSFKIE